MYIEKDKYFVLENFLATYVYHPFSLGFLLPSRCPPCKKLGQNIHDKISSYPKAVVAKINVDNEEFGGVCENLSI